MLTRKKLEDKIMEAFSHCCGIHLADVKLSSHIINDLGADSLDTIEIVMHLEEELGVEIDDTQAENIGYTAAEIADNLINWRIVKVEESEHEIKMRTDPEYKERYLMTRIPKGRIFTVSLRCVDEEASVDLMVAMFSKQPNLKLLAGCEVLRIDMRDEGVLHGSLRSKIKSLIEKDEKSYG